MITIPEGQIYIPPKADRVIRAPNKRFRVLYGGRGSGKSTAFANYVLERALSNIRILCCREVQNSIRDSVHRLLCDRILANGLEQYFIITQDSIKSRYGSEIIFRGLKTNPAEIKSLQGIGLCWVEEAERVSEQSWEILVPTIREENSEILVSFNPESSDSPAYQRFVLHPRDDTAVDILNYEDNDLFPSILRKEMEYDKSVDFETYEHIWLGRVRKYGQDVIFKDRIEIKEFDSPSDIQFYFGADFGYSVDPNTLARHFILDNCLYIDYEFYGVGVELEELPLAWETVPGSRKWRIRADSQRPDTISFMKKKGFDVVAAEKGAGSVDDGIVYLRKFRKIYIHPRCKGAIKDYTNYRWKRDRVTNEILPIPLDKFNHVPDSSRYALEPLIKSKVSGFDVV